MRKIIISLNLLLLISGLALGQAKRNKQNPEDIDQPARQRTVKNNDSKKAGNMENVLLESGTSLDAKLLSTLDVKKTEVGDRVVLKTTESIKQDGKVVVPKGTKLIGRVTQIQEKTKENSMSKISMVFESLQNKNLTAPINASIVSITNVRGNAQAADLFGADAMGSSRTTTSTGSSSGGGLLGGATNTVGGVLNTTTNTVAGVTNTVGNTANGATNTLSRTVNGIQISQSANVSAQGSSTFSAQNKNIRLEKGTTFQLQLNESVQH